LAQGSTGRQQEKSLEEEIEEKKRYMPPHLQVNLEQLDCVYMTTSMMLEVPNISLNRFNIAKKVISRNFRKLIEMYDQKGVQFVPTSNRDHIVAASRHLHKSKWQEAFSSISQLKFFSKMEEFTAGRLKSQLLQRFKEISMQIYVIECQFQYQSFSLVNI
jgi:translation initiation factor 3 subunit C